MFYYARGEARFGPVFESDMKALCDRGEIRASDRVWSPSIGPEWVDAGTLDMFKSGMPPGLPEVTPIWYYLMIASPIINAFLGLVYLPLMIVGGFLLHIILPICDIASIRSAGHSTFSRWFYLLAFLFLPAYLFVRAYMMRTHLAVPLLYIAASIAGNFIAAPAVAEFQAAIEQFQTGLPRN